MTPPAPLGVYIHWPYCARICPYCDFNVLRDRGRGEEQRALKDAILADHFWLCLKTDLKGKPITRLYPISHNAASR